MLGIVAGLVLGQPTRRAGTSGAGNEYDITTVRVLVAGQDVTPVTFATKDDLANGERPPRVNPGDLVAWLVDFGVYRQEPNARLVSATVPDEADTLAALTGALGAAV